MAWDYTTQSYRLTGFTPIPIQTHGTCRGCRFKVNALDSIVFIVFVVFLLSRLSLRLNCGWRGCVVPGWGGSS